LLAFTEHVVCRWITFRLSLSCTILGTISILLKKAEEYTGDKTAINASVGTAYFFRGMAYFDLLKTFGGVPIVDHVMDVNDEVLYGPRNSRYEVFNFLANDFRKAIELLPKESSIAENLHYTQRDYLDAIPLQQIRLNPALTQNPGW
jgi:hypothetical protein